jgi:hypothetical protein
MRRESENEWRERERERERERKGNKNIKDSIHINDNEPILLSFLNHPVSAQEDGSGLNSSLFQ